MAANPNDAAGYRLSPQQRAVWSLPQEVRASCRARLLVALRDAAAERVEEALRRLVARHEILRTTYRFPPGASLPLQVVEETQAFAFSTRDLSLLAPSERRREARALLAAPADGPLVSALLLRLGFASVLRLEMPALAADERSLLVLAEELGAVHAGAEPAASPLQYADYAEWREALRGSPDESARAGRAFWRAREEAVPTRFPLEREGTPAGEEAVAAAIDAGEVEEAARRLGVPLESFGLAAFQAYLAGWTGDAGVGLAVSCDGRGQPDLRRAVGLFEREIPLAATPLAEEPFAVRAHAVARELDAVKEAQDHHDGASFAGPLFSYREIPAVDGLRVLSAAARIGRAHPALELARRGGLLRATLRFDPSLLDREVAGRAVRGFAALLAAAAREPRTPLGELPLLDPRDRAALLETWTETRAPRRSATVNGLFEEQALLSPESEAVVCGEERTTYGALNARANRIAALLRSRGVATGAVVGLCLRPGRDLVASLLGVLKAGAAYLPLAHDHPPARLRAQVESAGVRLVITDSGLAERFDPALPLLRLDDAEGLLARHPAGDRPPHATADDLVYVISTSGSTGVPRPVAVTHRNLVSYVEAILALVAGLAPGASRWATASSPAADLGNTAIFPALLSGGVLHLVPRDVATDAALFAGTVAGEGIDVLKLVPSHLAALLGDPPNAAVLPRRLLFLGGEAFPRALAERIREAAPGLRVVNHYGPTETTVGALAFPLPPDGKLPVTATGTVPIGRPLAGARAYVLDARLEPLPPGAVGELFVGGAGVARGYLGMPEETAERFLADPFVPGGRLYRTGDRVQMLADGTVEFVGRTDDQVKVRGYRLELGELERTLAAHPAVRRAAAALRDGRLVAWVEAAEGERASILSFAAERLPEFLVPSGLALLPELPLLPSGKVDRRALPSPEANADGFVAPRDDVEASVAAIWAEVFGLPRLSVTANFFDLGGHSLMATQILSRLRRALGRALPPDILFTNPTVADLARAFTPPAPAPGKA